MSKTLLAFLPNAISSVYSHAIHTGKLPLPLYYQLLRSVSYLALSEEEIRAIQRINWGIRRGWIQLEAPNDRYSVPWRQNSP
ncbi:hypothetical protein [Geitlerinema sp. PCC 9228]|jgi:hypothetical protein|uniref:hypothetical protein n=1 Tax=Geitlerinema sp. PCC 9228 TaxID=111611 RepID=UPI0008F9BCA5|nr:hypothetical protein [Geitlerinema sp. PCC 9228]